MRPHEPWMRRVAIDNGCTPDQAAALAVAIEDWATAERLRLDATDIQRALDELDLRLPAYRGDSGDSA